MTDPVPLRYIVTARRQGEPPVRFTLMAISPSHAITTAQELLPGHLLSTAVLDPEWDDEPA
jgi:hypothetical protein